jgi:hypothetical protein
MEYQKINTLFKRDENNIIIPDEYTFEEFDYLENVKWECTEKIDGTNMRVELYPIPIEVGCHFGFKGWDFEFKGRTDKANIPTHLLTKMKELFTRDKLKKALDIGDMLVEPITIYGEGYGTKIQSGGNYIKNGVNFILFDVKIGNWWLKREDLEEIAKDLNIDIVPLIGYKTIPEAIEYVKKGFKSTIAENKDYDAEGLVLKTPCGLKFRSGERIITKIKTCDFKKYKARYGDDKVEQILNPYAQYK